MGTPGPLPSKIHGPEMGFCTARLLGCRSAFLGPSSVNTMPRTTLTLWLAHVLLWSCGVSSDVEEFPPETRLCDPGARQACDCEDGPTSIQDCAEGGAAWEVCRCGGGGGEGEGDHH